MVLHDARAGRATSLHVATSPDLAGVSGRYFKDAREVSPSRAARVDADAARLWTVSEELAGLAVPAR